MHDTKKHSGGCGCGCIGNTKIKSKQKDGYSKNVTKLILIEKDIKSIKAGKLTKTQGLKCPKGQIIRSAYITKTGHVVGAVCIKDTGKIGKTKRTIVLESDMFGKFGYKKITKLSVEQRRKALANAILRYGFEDVIKRLTALSNLTHRTHPEFSKRVKKDQDWISSVYKKAKQNLSRA